uniref:(northern house mosquito) hypothetical protein n=1 Tax=Culex pipiens TaxID=7175 RepID=A0A8D8CAJ2_CULPI
MKCLFHERLDLEAARRKNNFHDRRHLVVLYQSAHLVDLVDVLLHLFIVRSRMADSIFRKSKSKMEIFNSEQNFTKKNNLLFSMHTLDSKLDRSWKRHRIDQE